MNSRKKLKVTKVVSGGQTGADRGGIDAAIACEVSYGGWIPKGRKAEDGLVPQCYTELKEMDTEDYSARTEQNVLDSDGTVIFVYGKLTTGSALTKKFAIKHKKPCLHIDLDTDEYPTSLIINWCIENQIETLNVAGKSASKADGIYEKVRTIIRRLLNARIQVRSATSSGDAV